MAEEQPDRNEPSSDDTANQKSQQVYSGAIVSRQIPSPTSSDPRDIISVQIGERAQTAQTPDDFAALESLAGIQERLTNIELNKLAVTAQIDLKQREIAVTAKRVDAEIRDLNRHFWLKTIAIIATTSFGVFVFFAFSLELGTALFVIGMTNAMKRQNKSTPKPLDKFLGKPAEEKEDDQRNDKSNNS
jgi:hypothetical protein